MKEMKIGCGKPTGATVGGPKKENAPSEETNKVKEVSMAMIKIGTQAPDFEAPAFHNGKFIQVKLSDYLGKWVSLCFYPGDFTFV